MSEATVQIGDGGVVVIPDDMREAMGLAAGDVVLLVLDEGGLRVLTREQAIRRAQDIVRRHVAGDRRLSDELIAERRGER